MGIKVIDPVGLFVWLPGKHNTTPGTLGDQTEEYCVRKGWEHGPFEYTHHKPNQAQEGFTMTRTLNGLWGFIRRWQIKNPGKPVVVAGSGFGAWVALLVAIDARNTVDGVIMFTPSLNMIHEFLCFATRKYPWFLRGIMRLAIWYKYAYKDVFEYEVKKADGTKLQHKMPQSFLRDVGWNRFNVLRWARIRRASMPILAFTPNQSQEGFLSSVVACSAFCTAVQQMHGEWQVNHVTGQTHLSHSGSKVLTRENYDYIGDLLALAMAHHVLRRQPK